MKITLTIVIVLALLVQVSGQDLLNKNYEGYRLKMSEAVIDGDTVNDAIIDNWNAKVDTSYVDSMVNALASGGVKAWYFTKLSSGISTYYLAQDTLPTSPLQTITSTATDGESTVATFITPAEVYRVTEGNRTFYFNAKVSDATKNVQLKGEIYLCNLAGNHQTLLRASSLTPTLTESMAMYQTNVWGNSLLINDTIRIIFKIIAIKGDPVGTDPTVSFYVCDNTFSRLDVPVPSLALGEIVKDTIINGVTDIAPSQNAVFDELAKKQNLLVNSAGLAGALSDETGTLKSVFSDSPEFTTKITITGSTNSDNFKLLAKPWSVAYDSPTEAYIFSLTTYNGNLYAGSGNSGIIYAFDGTTWTTSYDSPAISIWSLTTYNGNLYAGSGNNGIIYKFDGTTWTTSYDSPEASIVSLTTYNGNLYAGSSNSGIIYAFNGTTWTTSYDSPEAYILSLTTYNGNLYAGSGDNGIVYKFDGSTWTTSYDSPEASIRSLTTYNGNLYAGSNDGIIYKFDGSTWSVAYDSPETYILSLTTYNGNLYAGSGDNGIVYKFDGSTWSVAYDSPAASIRSLTTYNGNLYAGSSVSGIIYKFGQEMCVVGDNGVTYIPINNLNNTWTGNNYYTNNVGIGASTPMAKLAVTMSKTTNLNGFNWVNTDINKHRLDTNTSTDTSSCHLSSTPTGSLTLHITGKDGSTQFQSDSVSTTFKGTYAGIYVADASTAQSIPTGTTYTKSTAFTTNGSSSNCTSDAANDKITITKTGHYLVNCPVSFSGATNNVNWKMAAFWNNTKQNQIHVIRKIGTGGDVGSATITGILNVTSVPTDLDVRFRHDQAGNENVTVVYSNLTVTYIGE